MSIIKKRILLLSILLIITLIVGLRIVTYFSNIQAINKLTLLAKSQSSELDAMQKLAQMSYDIDDMIKLSANLKMTSKIILLGVFYEKSAWAHLSPDDTMYYKELVKKYNQLIYQEIISNNSFYKTVSSVIKMHLSQIWVSNNLHLNMCSAMLDSISVDAFKHDDYKIKYFIERARLAEKFKKYNKYNKYLEKTLEFNSNPNTFFIESAISADSKNWQISYKCMEKYLELSYGKNWPSIIKKKNNNDDALDDALRIASLWESAGVKLEEMEALLKYFAYERNKSDAQNNLAYFWAQQGKNLVDAELLIQKAIKQKPKNGNFIDTYGYVLYKQGKYKEALSQFKKANELGKNDSAINNHFADTYFKLGNKKEARKYWQEALTLIKDDDELKKEIQAKLDKLSSPPKPTKE